MQVFVVITQIIGGTKKINCFLYIVCLAEIALIIFETNIFRTYFRERWK